MAVLDYRTTCELTRPVSVKHLNGMFFSQDVQANRIVVSVVREGTPENLSGTISANIIRADGATVAQTGTIEGNVASVTMPEAAYAIPGAIAVFVKHTQDGATSTLAAVTGYVYKSTTDTIVDPGTIIPSIQDLISSIEDATEDLEEAIAAIPQDYQDLEDDVSDLKNEITNKLELVEVAPSANKWNKDVASTGLLHTNGNVYTGSSYDMYKYGVSIPVSQGDEIRVFYSVNGSIALGTLTRVASYDSNGTIVPSSGGNEVKLYTVPSGITSVIITIMGAYNNDAMVILNDDTVPSSYIPYQEGHSYYVATDDFVPAIGDLDALKTTEKTNLVGAINETKELNDTLNLMTDEVLDIDISASRNLNAVHYENKTDGGVTFTVNSDNSISLSGTSTRDAYLFEVSFSVNKRYYLPAGTYTISGGISNSAPVYIIFYADQTTTTQARDAVYSTTSATTFTIDTGYYCIVTAYVASGTNTAGMTLYPQVEAGDTATGYHSPFIDEYTSQRLEDIEEDTEKISVIHDEVLDIETLQSKNLNTGKYKSRKNGNVTFTINDDGSISLSGTATASAFLYDGSNPGNRFELPAGEYTISGGYSNKIYIYINFYADQSTTTTSRSAVNSGANANSFTTDTKYYCSINVYVDNGTNTNGVTLYPQVETGGYATEYVSPAEYDESLRLKGIEENINELENEVIGSGLNVPAYYNTNDYLENKCKRFNLLARQCNGASDCFAFVTDLHWTQNAKKSPSLLRFIKKNTRIDKLFCGGDICDFEEVESRPYDAFSNFVKAWDNQVYTAIGNHEYLSQYGTEGRVYYSFNSLGKDRIGNLDRSYFYFDNPQAKIRYIFLSAYKANNGTVATGYEQAQLTWLQNEALDLDSGWGAIVVTHMTHSVYENASIGQTATDMLNVLDAYDGSGEIICVISGHTHADYYDTTTGGIPIIVTTCDKYMPWISGSTNMEPWLSDRVAGTITEQAIDLYLIDRTAKTISKVRVGCPIHYGTNPETWTEYEDVTISYERS